MKTEERKVAMDTFKYSIYYLMILFVALLVALPIASVLVLSLFPEENIWGHLASTVLPGYIRTTLLLMLGVVFGTLLIGVSTAWLVTMYQFPGRQMLSWSLLLPMAIPAYIIAYTYTGMLDFAGPVQTLLREIFNWRARDYWFPEIRSITGAMMMLSLVLYPYVYLLTRAAFLEQSSVTLEASRSLGMGPWRSFF